MLTLFGLRENQSRKYAWKIRLPNVSLDIFQALCNPIFIIVIIIIVIIIIIIIIVVVVYRFYYTKLVSAGNRINLRFLLS